MVSIWPRMVCRLDGSKHFGNQPAPLQFSTTMLDQRWPGSCVEFNLACHFIQKLFWFQIRYSIFCRRARPVSQTPTRCRARCPSMWASARSSAHHESRIKRATYEKSGQKKVTQLNRRQPQRHGRFFPHPVPRHLFLHAKKMHRGAAPFLHEAPQRLDVIMIHARHDPQPFALAVFHQEHRDVRCLELSIRLDRLQICTAIIQIHLRRADTKKFPAAKSTFHVAVARDELWIRRSSASNRIADVSRCVT